MDMITKSPGLYHIAERIFMDLDQEKLLLCEEVNANWKNPKMVLVQEMSTKFYSVNISV